jgi:CheY-like chemotaxis protein
MRLVRIFTQPNGDSAIEELASGESALESVKAMLQAAEKAAGLTRQLMVFSRRQMLQTEVLDLNSVVAESEKLVRRLIGEDIRLTFAPGPETGLVRADRGQIDQVIFNLAVNARDAMPSGGILKIETATVEVDEGEHRSNVESQPGSYVLLGVTDTGIGMDEATASHIFEPFFTTKEVGKGTGLGLSVVYGIVKQSNGFIRVHSAPGQGTQFKIYLPRVNEASAPVRDAGTPPLIWRGSETILLVEDEPALREKVGEILEQSGYKLLIARDGEEGLRVAFEDTRPIHLLLTDVVMPGLSGPELARRVQAVRPETRILYMSGYPHARDTASVVESGLHLISKPFTKENLLRRLRQILEAGAQQGTIDRAQR